MSTELNLRVADALHMLADRVRMGGLNHPERLSITLPGTKDAPEVTITAHIELNEEDLYLD